MMRASWRCRVAFAISLILAATVAALAHPGAAIALGRDGRVYFVDTGRGVFEISRDGRVSRHVGPAFHWFAIDPSSRHAKTGWPSLPDAEIQSVGLNPTLVLSSDFPVAIGRDGGLYYPELAPRTNWRILRVAPSGAPSVHATFPVQRKPDGSPNWRILRVAPSGAQSVHATFPVQSKPDGSPNWINGLAAAGDGSLYFTHDRTLRRISDRGVVSTIAANVTVPGCVGVPGIGPELQPYLRGLDVAPDGTVFVAASGCGAVLKITTAGQVTPVLRTASPYSPTAVAVSNGEVFVLEYLHTASDDRREWLPRVRKVMRSGEVATLVDSTQ